MPTSLSEEKKLLAGEITGRIRNPIGLDQCSRLFLLSAGGLLLFAGLEKLLNIPWSASPYAMSFDLNDPLLNIRALYVVRASATLEVLAGLLCLLSLRSGPSVHKAEEKDQDEGVTSTFSDYVLGLVAFIALNWFVFRAALWTMGWHHPYPFFFYLINGLGLSPLVADFLVSAVVLYLAGGSMTLLWQLRLSSEARESLKMSCPACGGHIRFAVRNRGQNTPCPHCRAAVILRKPDENLKMSCFFCNGHIEFPAHALGQKIPCAHCNMDITLKEPATA